MPWFEQCVSQALCKNDFQPPCWVDCYCVYFCHNDCDGFWGSRKRTNSRPSCFWNGCVGCIHVRQMNTFLESFCDKWTHLSLWFNPFLSLPSFLLFESFLLSVRHYFPLTPLSLSALKWSWRYSLWVSFVTSILTFDQTGGMFWTFSLSSQVCLEQFSLALHLILQDFELCEVFDPSGHCVSFQNSRYCSQV